MNSESTDLHPLKRMLSRVLPHEIAFGSFLVLMGVRLLIHGGDGLKWSLFFAGAVAGAGGLIWWVNQRPTPNRWRVRLLYLPAVMGLTFLALGFCLPILQVPNADAVLMKWEVALFGGTPSVLWEPYVRPWLTDLLMAAYLMFFYYLIIAPAYFCIWKLPVFRKLLVGLFVLYALAFTGYMLFPAGGPFRFIDFSVPLEGPLIYDRTASGVMAASNAVDVFPSVHFAATLYLLLFDWGHRRRHFWVMLVPCVLLWIATMYLRYHYAVDLLAGVGVALAGWFAAMAYERSGIAAVVDARERAAAAFTETPPVPASAKPQIISSSGQIPE